MQMRGHVLLIFISVSHELYRFIPLFKVNTFLVILIYLYISTSMFHIDFIKIILWPQQRCSVILILALQNFSNL